MEFVDTSVELTEKEYCLIGESDRIDYFEKIKNS